MIFCLPGGHYNCSENATLTSFIPFFPHFCIWIYCTSRFQTDLAKDNPKSQLHFSPTFDSISDCHTFFRIPIFCRQLIQFIFFGRPMEPAIFSRFSAVHTTSTRVDCRLRLRLRFQPHISKKSYNLTSSCTPNLSPSFFFVTKFSTKKKPEKIKRFKPTHSTFSVQTTPS